MKLHPDVLKRRWAKSRLRTANERCRKELLDFDITLADIETPDRCPVLGVELDYNIPNWRLGSGLGRWSDTASLDRHNSALGYVKGNLRTMSWQANRLKNNANSGELLALAAYVAREQEYVW